MTRQWGRALLRAGWQRRTLTIPFVVLLLLRLPSLAEPHWYTDEAGYTTTAQAMLHGTQLYSGIWNNKPPVMLWMVAMLFAMAGPRIWALHLFTLLCSGLAIAAGMWLMKRQLSPRYAVGAGVAGAVILGLPVIDAQLLLPESILVAPVSWACVLVIDHICTPEPKSLRGLVLAGGLAGLAIGIQQTAIAETGFITLAILAASPRRRKTLAAFAIPCAAVIAIWLGWAVLSAGWGPASFALITWYVSYAQTGTPTSRFGLGLLQQLSIIGAVMVLGFLFARRRRGLTSLTALWLGMSALAAGAANHPYAHFLVPVVVPLCMTVAAFGAQVKERWIPRRGSTASAALGAGVAVAGLLAIWSSGLDWIPSVAGPHTLSWYYTGYARSIFNSEARQRWADGFDSRVAADRDVVRWLDSNHLLPTSLVVWSSDAWIYALTDTASTLPTPPIYNDIVLLGSGNVVAKVAALHPTVIVTADFDLQTFPEIKSLLQSSYHQAYVSAPDTVWIAGAGA